MSCGIVCPKSPFWLVSVEGDGAKIPRPCGTYLCPICRDAKVHERMRVMTWGAGFADRCRLVTLTLAPGRWEKARGQVRDLRRRLKKYMAIEWAWAIEANPRSTGYHVHAVQHGDFMDKEIVSRLWGGRFVDIRMISATRSTYAAKCATVCGYAGKNLSKHLEINGNRAVHMSRGYLHGLTSREVLQLLSTGRRWVLQRATEEEVNESINTLNAFQYRRTDCNDLAYRTEQIANPEIGDADERIGDAME